MVVVKSFRNLIHFVNCLRSWPASLLWVTTPRVKRYEGIILNSPDGLRGTLAEMPTHSKAILTGVTYGNNLLLPSGHPAAVLISWDG